MEFKPQISRTWLCIAIFSFSGFLIVYFGGALSEKRALETSGMTGNHGPLHIDIDGIKVAYYDYSPGMPQQTIILLHGMRFSKENWKKLGTLDILLKNGYRAIALDLPGYGESGEITGNVSRENFLELFIAKVTSEAPVMVSPSMSGEFAIPMVFSEVPVLKGWVPVAPVSITSHTLNEYKSLDLPVLALYGENDSQFRKQVEEYLGVIPGVKLKMVPGGSHPCYLDNPDMWHSALLYFLRDIK